MNYGTSVSLGNFNSNSNLVSSHSITIDSLSASTIYLYNITSCDSFGSCTNSGGNQLTTAADSGESSSSSGSSGSSGSSSIVSSCIYIVNLQRFKRFYVLVCLTKGRKLIL